MKSLAAAPLLIGGAAAEVCAGTILFSPVSSSLLPQLMPLARSVRFLTLIIEKNGKENFVSRVLYDR